MLAEYLDRYFEAIASALKKLDRRAIGTAIAELDGSIGVESFWPQERNE